MSAAHAYARIDADADPPPTETTLTQRLDTKLAELRAAGYRIQWIEMDKGPMITLFTEGGDEVIRLDPDPASDKAWYGGVEVRHTTKACVWIWLEGEHDEPSAHVID